MTTTISGTATDSTRRAVAVSVTAIADWQAGFAVRADGHEAAIAVIALAGHGSRSGAPG
jgi:hypothetical protein